MAERFITVHRSYDPIQTELLGDLLRENNIAARVLGTRNASIIGVAQNIVQTHIEVPESQAGAATDFLEAYFASEPEFPDADQDFGDVDAEQPDDEGTADDDDLSQPLRPTFAAGSVMLIFGGAHIYARQPITAGILALGQVLALSRLGAQEWTAVATGIAVFAGILAVDLIGGQLAVREHNRGYVRGPARQAARGTVLLLLAGGLGALIGSQVPEPKGKRFDASRPLMFHAR